MAWDKEMGLGGGGEEVDFLKYKKSILSFSHKIQLFPTQQSTIWKWTEVEQFKNNM